MESIALVSVWKLRLRVLTFVLLGEGSSYMLVFNLNHDLGILVDIDRNTLQSQDT